MTYRVNLRTPTTVQVQIKNNGGVLQPYSSTPITLPTIISTGGSERLDGLEDFVEGTPQDGWIVAYRSADDKYYVQPIANVSISLDGGSF